jgi:hypothetical protein
MFGAISARASSAGALDEEGVGTRTEKRDKALIATWSFIATVDAHPTVAPATGALPDSPAKAGRSVPGSDFSDREARSRAVRGRGVGGPSSDIGPAGAAVKKIIGRVN